MIFEAIIYKIDILETNHKLEVSFSIVIPENDTIAVIKDLDSHSNIIEKYGFRLGMGDIDTYSMYKQNCIIDFDGEKYSLFAI